MRYILIDYTVEDDNGNRKFRTIGIDTERNEYCSWDEGGLMWENTVSFDKPIDPVGLLESLRNDSVNGSKNTGFWVSRDGLQREIDNTEKAKMG